MPRPRFDVDLYDAMKNSTRELLQEGNHTPNAWDMADHYYNSDHPSPPRVIPVSVMSPIIQMLNRIRADLALNDGLQSAPLADPYYFAIAEEPPWKGRVTSEPEALRVLAIGYGKRTVGIYFPLDDPNAPENIIWLTWRKINGNSGIMKTRKSYEELARGSGHYCHRADVREVYSEVSQRGELPQNVMKKLEGTSQHALPPADDTHEE